MGQVSLSALPLEATTGSDSGRLNRLALAIAVVCFAALSLWMAIASKGFLEADGLTHYMFSRHAFNENHYFWSVWGRPLCTGVYAIPAAIGKVLGVRVMSLLLAVATGLVTYRIAKNQGYRLPALAALLLFAQPLYFLHSFSELTEVPFAFVATLAVWAFQARQFFWMTVAVSILPMGRPEGFGLIFLACLALLHERKWYYFFIIPLPLVIWTYFGWRSVGSPADTPWYMWLPRNWPYALKSLYGKGPWYHFLLLLPALLSPGFFPVFFIGVWRCLTGFARPQDSKLPAFLASHTARVQTVIVTIPLMVFFVHSVLWMFGLMASNGELRYLLCVAPMWALVCAKGFEWVWMQFPALDRWSRQYGMPGPFRTAGLLALLPVIANMYYRVVPLRIYAADLMAREAAEWYAGNGELRKAYPKVMSSPPAIYFALDMSASDKSRAESCSRESVARAPMGTILFWDPIYGPKNASAEMCVTIEQVEAAGWVWIGNVVYEGEWCNVYLSPQQADGTATNPRRWRTPGDVTPR